MRPRERRLTTTYYPRPQDFVGMLSLIVFSLVSCSSRLITLESDLWSVTSLSRDGRCCLSVFYFALASITWAKWIPKLSLLPFTNDMSLISSFSLFWKKSHVVWREGERWWVLEDMRPMLGLMSAVGSNVLFFKDSPQLPSTHHQLWTTLDIAFFQTEECRSPKSISKCLLLSFSHYDFFFFFEEIAR